MKRSKSAFGGQSGSAIEPRKISSTTFDNISNGEASGLKSENYLTSEA